MRWQHHYRVRQGVRKLMGCYVSDDSRVLGRGAGASSTGLRRLAIVCFEDPRHVTGGVQRRIAGQGAEVVVLTEGPGASATIGNVQYIPVPTPPVLYPLRTLIFSARVSAILRRLPACDVVETHHDAGAAVVLTPVRD